MKIIKYECGDSGCTTDCPRGVFFPSCGRSYVGSYACECLCPHNVLTKNKIVLCSALHLKPKRKTYEHKHILKNTL